MVGAVAMFAAVSCAQELKQDNQLPEGEVVVFEATVDGADTKAYLEVVGEGEEQRTFSRWHNDDKITIHNGTTGFEFATSEADVTNGGATARFSYVGNDFSGEKFMAVYPAGSCTDADVATKTVNVNIPKWQQAEDDSFPKNAAVAVAYTDDNTLKFKNAAALLKFTMNMDDVTHVYFKGNNGETVVGEVEVTINDSKPSVVCLEEEDGKIAECYVYGGTFTKGTTYYMAVAPQIFEGGVELKIKRNVKDSEPEEIVVRSTTNKVETKANTVLNLGEIGGMSYTTAPRVEKIYLKPGVWAVDEAWFAAHFFNPIGGTEDVKMTESEEYPGIYEVSVPKGADKVVFCRMNPDADTFDWGEYVWDQSANLDLPNVSDDKFYYVISDWKTGDWMTCEDATAEPEVPVPGLSSEWAVAGTFNSWEDAPMVTTSTPDVYVAKNISLEGYAEFKIKQKKSDENDGWGTNYGVKNINYLNANVWIPVQSGSGTNIYVVNKGTYDIYFDKVNSRIYVMTAGTDFNSANEQTTNGKAPVIDNARTIYLKAGAWNTANAWFIAYTWGGTTSAAMVKMEASSKGDGIYECKVPNDRTNIIFLRKNPANTGLDWSGEWNRFEMTLPTDKNCFTVNSNWGNGGWSNI